MVRRVSCEKDQDDHRSADHECNPTDLNVKQGGWGPFCVPLDWFIDWVLDFGDAIEPAGFEESFALAATDMDLVYASTRYYDDFVEILT